MEVIRAGGRRYSDPDVVALIRAGGGLADPRSLIVTQARQLNERYRRFDTSGVTPRERVVMLASLARLDVLPMNLERRKEEARDAVVLLGAVGDGMRGQVFYNPDRPEGRVNFSIAHEIGHTFFPRTSGGTRFRELCKSDSREANELERLCDLAAAELLMPAEEFQAEVGSRWSLAKAIQLAERFGSSFEATAYRLASAHPGIAAAGLVRFRLTNSEQEALVARAVSSSQGSLFRGRSIKGRTEAVPKYRRQSFYASYSFPDELIVRWNKSFDKGSVVYRAAETQDLLRGEEPLPNGSDVSGSLEVLRAPYQRSDSDSEHPDLIFFWTVRSRRSSTN